MYKSLASIAKMFDISIFYIKKHYLKDMQEGVHYVYIGKMKRFDVNEVSKLLVSHTKPKPTENKILDNFLI